MGRDASGPFGPGAPPEVEQQCRMRDVNEGIERLNAALSEGDERVALRCECGDPACQAMVSLTHAEYEAVRAYGSHFVVGLNHENPESDCVLAENAAFAVVDVVARDARYQVLGRNPRHAWSEILDRSSE